MYTHQDVHLFHYCYMITTSLIEAYFQWSLHSSVKLGYCCNK